MKSKIEYPLVTIGIPTYKRADGYLKQALESALNQTYSNLEIVVSDNCSPDNTEEVVTGYSDPRLRYIKHEKNIGPNNNFNYCLEQARGVYFLLLHDDDLIDPDFVSVCMEETHYDLTLGIIRTGTRVIDSLGNVKREIPNEAEGLSHDEFMRGWFELKTGLYMCSTLFNTEKLKAMGALTLVETFFQDVIAEFMLAAQYGRGDIRDVKASFRNHEGEITHRVKVSDWCEDSLQLVELVHELASENKDVMRQEATRFLVGRNYGRVRNTNSFFQRLASCYVVFSKFGYKYLPPFYVLFPRNPIARQIRRSEKNRRRREAQLQNF